MDKIEVKKRADELDTFQWPLMGYAPGHYMRSCLDCKAVMTHCDKRATQCLSCALTSILATRTDATPVAWMYEGPMGEHHIQEHRDYAPKQLVSMGWTETPLFAGPPLANK